MKCPPRSTLLFLAAWAGAAAGFLPAAVAGAVRPSQVLVLYNEDWTDDAPLTDPGQDSKEIAEHYAAMHTDPGTGEKPYLLGLRCVHRAGHLNRAHLGEGSRDNGSGVVLRRSGKVVGPAGELRDSRALEFALPDVGEGYRWETFRLQLKPNRGDPVVLVEGGVSRIPGQVAVQREGSWTVRANARALVPGPFLAEATIEDGTGELHRWRAEYQDILDVSCSRTGVDGVRDDQNYLDDVERPVQAFLEDPANARPDGTLLKDHILFVVVCYGLPKTATATYGIERGVTDRHGDFGAQIDLGQRLQLLYYDVEGAMGFVPRPHRFRSNAPFRAYLFRAPQAWALEGFRANPFIHPDAYRSSQEGRGAKPALPFTPENRARFPGRHLYFSSRVDGATPLEARGLIDRAVYASRFAGPDMGRIEGVELPGSRERVGDLWRNPAGKAAWERGYRHLWYTYAGNARLQWLRLGPGLGFFNRTAVFLPGGVAGVVVSHNGWNRKGAALLDALARGVTATAGTAKVAQGVPHIHNKSWWDDLTFYDCLLGGSTLGECWFMNQIHLEWVTSFVGDPLYRLPLEPEKDRVPPRLPAQDSVHFRQLEGADGGSAVWARADLATGPQGIEVAQMRLTPLEGEGGDGALCQTFEGRPYTSLGPPAQVLGRRWRLELLDPYGNRSETTVTPRIESRAREGRRLQDQRQEDPCTSESRSPAFS
ncbi:MAG: hypothetical protein Kow0092_37980 [Deferrisomatales bacterium]